MAMSGPSGGIGRRGRGARRAPMADINVTPLVDVMLVLLIIFMISAPLLTSGVQVELPKTEAGAMQDQAEPITLTVKANGQIFVGEAEIPFASLKPRLERLSRAGYDKPIYVRADGRASYEVVAQVMAALQGGGFTKINLITDTGGPSSGESQKAAATEGQSE
ncbi:MAG TPA: ExbD/TolR family protein, partial [Caulobacter sp.]|nr:ExbD/TolR family protein [Caulobacter sp.]